MYLQTWRPSKIRKRQPKLFRNNSKGKCFEIQGRAKLCLDFKKIKNINSLSLIIVIMKIQLLSLKITTIFFAAFIISCANMVSPNGGLKDEAAPILVKAKPQNLTTNFKGKKIELTFNEYINLKDIQTQLIVSPGDVNAEVKKAGKVLTIELDNTPQDSATYIINFGDAISDYTENNISKDFKYIFSTADVIDSLKISGRIVDAIKKEIVKDVIVCLYNTYEDSVVYKRKPDYTVRSNETGSFLFTNLKAGKYKLFLIKEENNNKIFDSQEEEIGFIDTLIDLKENNKLNELILFIEKPLQRKLINKGISYQKVELLFNKKNNIQLTDLDKSIDTVIYSKNKDSILVYYSSMPDTSYLFLTENNKIDTVKIKFSKSAKKSDLNIAAEPKIIGNNVIIKSNDLFDLNQLDSLILQEDSINVKFNLTKTSYNNFVLNYKFDLEKNYILKISDSVFKSYQGSYNKEIYSRITFFKEEELGTLKINEVENNTIYELMNERNEIVRRTIITDEESINYKNLFPGSYRLRIISDTNKNGIWDTGNYLQKLQPEKIIYYNNPIKIRANWDLEIQLITL